MKRWTKGIALFLWMGLLAACGTEKEPEENECGAGRTLCGSVCVDLASSRTDCGACGNACAEGEVCIDSECTSVCETGRTFCDGACVDLDTDPENCGACGNVCDQVCQDGECRIECSDGKTDCDGACVDLGSDPANCGGCGIACGETEICSDSACVCPEGTERCGDVCVNTRTDVANCGGCGRICGQENAEEVSCVDGGCQIRCLDGFDDCDEDPANGCEADLDSPASCGACGVTCRDDQVCADGACGCPEGFEECDGVCVDTSSDSANCGSCGFSCEGRDNTVSGACVEGKCELECTGSFADCDGDAENGCEVPILSDPENCGGCGIACREDQLCGGGECICSGGRTECDGVCVDLLTDPNHCNECGNVCPDGGACAEGVCCEPGLAACGAACVDLADDPENCGSCGNSCLDFPNTTSGTCEEGTCTTIACAAGFEDCNGDITDGCEIDLMNDPANCGACGNAACTIGCGEGACATIEALSARNDHGCVVLSGGAVKCWGNNRDGQIGNGLSGTGIRSLVPEFVQDPNDPTGRLSDAVEVATGFGHSCVRTQTGNVKCWGQLMDPQGSVIVATSPVTIQDPKHPSGLLSDVVQLASGRNFLCALIQGGTVECWGAVPDGTNNTVASMNQPLPQPVLVSTNPDVPLSGVVQIAAGNMHACALLGDGSVRCWGKNQYGQLGTGNTDPSLLPLTVGDGTTDLDEVVEIALSQDHSCARKSDGTVHCWGRNNSLQLGVTGISQSESPVQVVDVANAVQLSAGLFNHTCARLADGTAKCWGSNSNGKLGNGGSGNSQALPVKDATGTQDLSGILHIEAGNAHTCAVLGTERIVCWGRNNNGQIGDGTTTNAATPTDVVW